MEKSSRRSPNRRRKSTLICLLSEVYDEIQICLNANYFSNKQIRCSNYESVYDYTTSE